MRHVISQHWFGRGLLVAALTVALGCPPDNGTQPGTLTLAVNPTSASVQQGGSAQVAATATSGGGFSGTVAFAISGAPAGVTAAVSNIAVAGSTTTATVTIQVALSTVPGVYNITVRATGAGVADGTAAFALTVLATPDYSLSLAPAALTIVHGTNSNTAVTITRTNFTDVVTLSLAGAPAGVTGAFVPAAPTGTSSTLTVSVGGAVAPGTYNLTVNGTGTPGNRSTALTLTVTPTPDYTLSLAPAALTIAQGANGTSTVTITRTNFTGAVTLSVGSAPAGVTGAFVPAAPTGTSSTLTLSVGGAVAPGTYNLTVDGTGTAGNRSTPLALTVTLPPPDYTLSVAPTALTIVQGANDVATVTITRTNFTGAVTLSVGNAPANVTGVFAPAAPTGTSSTLTLSVGAAVVPGTYNLTVDGSGTPGNRSTPLTLTVLATPDYTLSLAPAALTIVQGANGTSTVTITRTNFTGAVTLSVGNAPTGVTGVFAPAAPTGTSSTLTLSVAVAVAPGTYNLTVDGTGTAGNRSTALSLTVAPTPDYTLSLAPATLTIGQGTNGNSTVTITRTNFTGAVTLSVGNAPVGVTGVFAPAAPTGTSSTLTLSVGAAVAPGTYNLTVDGTGPAGNKSTPLTLTVDATPNYALSLTPATLSIVQGTTDSTDVTITRTNFTGAVTLSVANAPAGVTGVFVPAAPTGTSSKLTLSVDVAVAPGTYNLTVDGTGAPGSRSTALTLTVLATPDYALSLAPAALSIVQGSSDSLDVTITRTNFTGAVTLSLSTFPGLTGVFVPAAPTGTGSKLTVSVGVGVAPGNYNLTVDGTGTAGDRSAALVLTVLATPNYALSVAPTALTIGQGNNANTTVTITRTNFTGAVTLSLGNAPAGVTGAFVPAAPTGTSSTLTVTVGGPVAPGVYNLTVDGTGTPGSRSTALQLTVTATPNYELTIAPTALTIAQSANGNTTVTITRTNFTGAVTLSLGGAPAGVTGVFAPAAPTGTSSTLTVSVGASVTPATYSLTVDGSGTPGSRSTALTLTVTGSGGGNVTVSFAGCPVADRAVWLAYKDGAGAWVRVTPSGDSYTFGIASGTGGIAYVVLGGGSVSSVQVQYMTQAELTAGTLTFCGSTPTTRTFSGTAAGLGFTEQALISLGGGTGTANFFALPFNITGVRDGTHDLVGFKSDPFTPGAERALLHRDIVVNGNGSVGTVDFGGVESFAAASATITVTGLLGGDIVSQSMAYQVGATCEGAGMSFGSGGPTFTAYGIPGGQQRASDYHRAGITAVGGGATDMRSVSESFHTLAARTVTLGASLPIPVIGNLGGPYKRLSATFMLPADYQTNTGFTYSSGGDKSASLFASFGFLGGSSVSLGLDDFSALEGWDNNWAPSSAAAGNWILMGTGFTGGSACTENARMRSATRFGSF